MQIKINKRSAYAPIRYEASRPYAETLGKAFITESKRGDQARALFIRERLLPLLKIAAAKKPGFKAGKALKEAVN